MPNKGVPVNLDRAGRKEHIEYHESIEVNAKQALKMIEESKEAADYATGQGDRAKEYSDNIDNVMKNGPVQTVNGKTGQVTGLAEQAALDKTNQQLADNVYSLNQRSLNLKDFKYLVEEGDWSNAVETLFGMVNSVGGGVIDIPFDVYVYKKKIHLDNPKNITVNGNGSILMPDTSTIYPFEIGGGAENLIFNNLIFDGDLMPSSRIANGHLVTLRESDNVTFNDCLFRNLYYGTTIDGFINGNDGVYLRTENHRAGYGISNVHFNRCRFKDISRNGVSVVQGENIFFNGILGSVRRSVIDVEPNHDYELSRNIYMDKVIADCEGTSKTMYNQNDGTTDNLYGLGYAVQVYGEKLDSRSSLIENISIVDLHILGNDVEGVGMGLNLERVKDVSLDNIHVKNMNKVGSEIVKINSGNNNLNEDISINNLSIENHGEATAFYLHNSKNVNGDVSVKNGTGMGVYLQNPDETLIGLSKSVLEVHLENCGSEGVTKAMARIKDVTLKDSTFLLNDGRTVDYALFNADDDKRIKLINFILEASNGSKIMDAIQANGGKFKNFKAERCLFKNAGRIRMGGVSGTGRDYTFLDCEFEDMGNLGIGLSSTVFKGNQLKNVGKVDEAAGYAVTLGSASYLNFSDNKMIDTRPGMRGVELDSALPNAKRIVSSNALSGYTVDFNGHERVNVFKNNI